MAFIFKMSNKVAAIALQLFFLLSGLRIEQSHAESVSSDKYKRRLIISSATGVSKLFRWRAKEDPARLREPLAQ